MNTLKNKFFVIQKKPWSKIFYYGWENVSISETFFTSVKLVCWGCKLLSIIFTPKLGKKIDNLKFKNFIEFIPTISSTISFGGYQVEVNSWFWRQKEVKSPFTSSATGKRTKKRTKIKIQRHVWKTDAKCYFIFFVWSRNIISFDLLLA